MNAPCPRCGTKGRPVKPITLDSLVKQPALSRVGGTEGFRFCAEPACDVAYYQAETGHTIAREDVRVRIGQKEAAPPRPVCYCFEHTVEDIEADVAASGASPIPAGIAEQCRQGLDRCEETNPQGSCCLGNVRSALLAAQARFGTSAEGRPSAAAGAGGVSRRAGRSGPDARTLAQFGALASAIVASACCWLPLLLLAMGISGGALSATFAAWRPVLLPVTFVLLAAAFYLTYRKPRPAAAMATGAPAADACCSAEVGDVEETTCCPPENAGGFSVRRLNKVMLWGVTAFVLAFAFFPSYVGYLLGGAGSIASRADLDTYAVTIDGMTCEACAATLDDALRAVPGVAAAEVNYERQAALVGVTKGAQVPRDSILAAISDAGYSGRFADQVRWELTLDGMTCQGCAAKIEAELLELHGVRAASVSYEAGEATVTTETGVDEESLKAAVRDAGFAVSQARAVP